MATLNDAGQRLLSGLLHANHLEDARRREHAHAEKINVVGAGGAVTAAYEQLRKAAENTEEHLLLQNAIRRFYKQLFVMRDEKLVRTSGNELAIELTFAGYVPNDSLTKQQVDRISQVAREHYETYEIFQKRRNVSADTSTSWILDTLAGTVALIISPQPRDNAFVDDAYAYFENIIQNEYVSAKDVTADEYGVILFVAIHRALLKSDTATIRAALFERYRVSVTDIDQYIAYNKQIDRLLASPLSDQLFHIIDRHGAPMRIIRQMIEDNPETPQLLPRHDAFLEAYEQQVNKSYGTIITRINRAIIRSVMFLVITKFLIGIAIEVPYDLWTRGQIMWQPLLINLFFPPLYMIALRLTLTLPGYANTTALVDHADRMLYGKSVALARKQLVGRRYSPVFSGVYILLSLAIFAFVTWVLLLLGFSIVHIIIFFVFVSAASFLGFRLSRLVRELEVVRPTSNGLTFIRDVIYLPFVVVGQWMSDKYARMNIVTLILDMVIELPLKTILRLIRQWGAFIDDRKDQI